MHRTQRFATLSSIFVFLTSLATGEAAVTRNSTPTALIVLSDSPSAQAQRAAEVLQTFLERMSGAKLPIVAESGAPGCARILVGQSKAVEQLGVDVPSGFTMAMNEEGYVVKTVDDTLVLAGNEDRTYQGTMYAVYDALETLGCRWYFPGPLGEVVPQSNTIVFPDTDRVERPSFRFRNIWYSGWMPASAEDQQWFSEWCERNRVNSLAGLSLPGDGTVTRLVPPEKYFDTHPQAFALGKAGQREREMVCPTEPEAARIAAETIKEAFRANPDQISFGFGPPDGHPRCYCARCEAAIQGFSGKGFGDPSLSDLWFIFANRVAEEVYREFPERWILTNGYANRVRPPEGVGPLSPNLGIQSAMLSTCTLHRIDDPRCWQRQLYAQILRRWTNDLRCVFVYDYDPGKSLDGTPFSSLRLLEHDIRWLHDRGVWGFWTEGQNVWMVTQLNYYVRSRLMWNVEEDVEDIVHDFCTRFYGPAARPVERYLWTIQNALDDVPVHTWWSRPIPWVRVLAPDEEELERLVEKAERSAATGLEKARVQLFRRVHDHLMAYVAMERAAADGQFDAALEQTHCMASLRDEIEGMQHGLLPRDNELAAQQEFTLTTWTSLFEELNARINGSTGNLIALLPRTWEFRADLHDEGVLYQWYLPGHGDDWRTIDVTDYWEHQGEQDKSGHGYWGKAWYRTTFAVPADAAGRPLTLTLAGVATDRDAGGNRALWVWVNGNLIDAPSGRIDHFRPLDLDVTPSIRPGETNSVALLVQANRLEATQHNGLHRRAFLWSPRNAEPADNPH